MASFGTVLLATICAPSPSREAFIRARSSMMPKIWVAAPTTCAGYNDGRYPKLWGVSCRFARIESGNLKIISVNLRIVEHIRYWMYQSEYIFSYVQYIKPSFFFNAKPWVFWHCILLALWNWPNWKRRDKDCNQNDVGDDAHLQFLGGMERIHDFNFQLPPPSSFKDGWQVRLISK